MTSKYQLPRDLFINQIFQAAQKDKDIFFISADFGAPALDSFRKDLPKQFIHSGISEQHMINMATGLALSGKKVYAYAMAPFISLRCFEQIKGTISLMNQPVTLISVGVGLAYADSGPTHYVTEDLACLRSLNGMEVLTASDTESVIEIAKLTLNEPASRYVRLDRHHLPPIYKKNCFKMIKKGFCELYSGEVVCILTSGYMLQRAVASRDILAKENISLGVIDLFCIKPKDCRELISILKKYNGLVTLEEQGLDGGFGSAVLEVLADRGLQMKVKRLGLNDGFAVVNGDRNHLHKLYGLDTGDIVSAVMELENN